MKKAETAKKIIAEVETETKEYFKQSNIVSECEKYGLYYQDVSAWIHGRRKWSADKVLKVAGKI